MSTIVAPTPGRIVLYNASHLGVPKPVPAIVHEVIAGSVVSLWAVSHNGTPLLDRGAMPVAHFGEQQPGVPARSAWCYVAANEETVVVIDGHDDSGERGPGSQGGSRREQRVYLEAPEDMRRRQRGASDFDPEATADYSMRDD